MKLEERIKELIAVGASVTANCQPCLKYHVSKALESGAKEDEITEAVSVARMVRKGAMAEMDKFASGIFRSAVALNETSEGHVSEGCGCKS
jgi:AhpD family alkylhydroperoxidase